MVMVDGTAYVTVGDYKTGESPNDENSTVG